MKTHLLGALVGLAISFALPTFAQLKEVVDPQIRQQIEAAQKNYDVAFNKNDAAAVVALMAPDMVETGPWGPAYGREAVEKRYKEIFEKFHPTGHVNTIDKMFMLDDKACVIMKWSIVGQQGYVTLIMIPKGNDWLVQVADFSVTPPPPASPSPTTTPSGQ